MSDYEQFLALAQARRSIRQFSRRTVNREDLLRVFEAARWAPSNHNRQPWRFMVLQNQKQIAQLADRVRAGVAEKLKSLPQIASGYAEEFTHYSTFFSAAPVVIVVLHKHPVKFSDLLLKGVGQPELISGEPLSAVMAVQNLLLAAHTLGLGACVLTAPMIVREVFSHELNPGPAYDFTCLIALGYPEETPEPPRRKTIEQVVQFIEDRNKHENG